MALQSSGSISLYDVNIELGVSGTTTRSLNDSTTRTLFGVASGAISMSNGYGKSNRLVANITISANTQNYTLNTAKVAGYVAGKTDVVLTINSGVAVGSSSTGSYALTVDTSWNAADTVTIVNNGYIVGAGGNGGAAVNNNAARPGAAGGPALRVLRATSVRNNNIIGGGGGGGSSGYSVTLSYMNGNFEWVYEQAYGGGGGGGAGYTAGVGNYDSSFANSYAYRGATGATTTGGAGYKGSLPYGGGAGGNLGSAGSAGAAGPYSPAAAGAAGACTSGNSSITWLATGTRYGALN